MNIDSFLQRIEQKESQIRAWAFHDPELVKAQLINNNKQGSLAGLPIGIKDIYDTHDMPTAYGSAAYNAHRPVRDSWAVQRLRAAGAIIMGKTVTTEFAYVHAGPTRNPHNIAHTPGGSSSGSAAAVAAGMVPVALGSQTGGSTIRPSAYCGVVGFKPTHGNISLQGVMPLSPALDTLGIHAASIDLARQVFVALCLRNSQSAGRRASRLRIAWHPGPHAEQAQPQALKLLRDVRDSIQSSGLAQVEDLKFADVQHIGLCDTNRLIMQYEAARMHRSIYETDRARLGAATIGLIESGLGVSPTAYEQAIERVSNAYLVYMRAMSAFDAVLTLSAPGEAPEFEQGTGSSVFNQPWTTLGVPCLTLPAGKGPKGLPLGIQLVGKPGEDLRLLEIGQKIQQTCLIA